MRPLNEHFTKDEAEQLVGVHVVRPIDHYKGEVKAVDINQHLLNLFGSNRVYRVLVLWEDFPNLLSYSKAGFEALYLN